MTTEQNRAIIRRFAEESINAASMAVFDDLGLMQQIGAVPAPVA